MLNKIKATTTKKLTWTVMTVWIITVAMAIVSAIVFDVDLVSLVSAVSVSLSIILTGYFSKSFLENKEMNAKKEEEMKEEIVSSITETASTVTETIMKKDSSDKDYI